MDATATKKQSGVKTKIKNAGQKVKTYGKSYADDITCAHDIGYALGWDHAYDIPNRLFAKTAATYGFKKGMRNKHRVDKYTKTYQKKGKKY